MTIEDKRVQKTKCTAEERLACDHILANKTVEGEDGEQVAACELFIPATCPKIDCREGLVCPMGYAFANHATELVFPCSTCIGPDAIESQLIATHNPAVILAEELGK